MAVKKRVKVSKNKKKNWNKYCDVQEVEDYLEEKRFEERIGGRVSDKPDEELFVVQKTADVPSSSVKKPKFKKSLKCFQNIGSFSQVPPPITINETRYTKRIKHELEKKVERYSKKIAAHPPKPKKDVKNKTLFDDEFCDLWADDKKEIDPEMKDLIAYHEEIMEKRAPKLPKHRAKKSSLLPAVEVPHAGASYNPTYKDHQELLQKALVIEEKKEKEELHLKRVLDDMFPSKSEAPTQESVLQEMSQGLFDNSDDEEEEPAALFSLHNPPVSSEDRLPKSRHRKRKEFKEQERLKSVEKLNRKRLNEIYRLRSIKNEIKTEIGVSEQKQEKRLKRKQEKLYKPQTLSRHKYEEPDLELNLCDELTGSLRTLKPEGNILEDRYKSLQRRNLIEPRILQNRKRKYKLKRQVKRNHRDFK